MTNSDLSIEQWQRRISAEPLSVPAWLGFAIASLREGKLRDGLIGFRVAAQYGRLDPGLAREVATEAARLGLWSIVTEALEQADPADVSLGLLAGEAQYRAGSAGRAKQIAESLLEPAPASAMLLLAQSERRAGRAAAAESLLLDLLQKHPMEGPIRAALVECLVERGNTEQAQRLLDQAHELGLRDAAFLVLRGRIAEHLKGHATAADMFREALTLDPYHVDALLWLARLCLRNLADPGEAATLIRRLLLVAPTHSVAMVLFADIGEATGALGEAVDRLTEFYTAFPADHRIGLRLVKLLVTVGEGTRATEVAAGLLAQNARGRAFVVDLAVARASTGDWARAIDDLHQEFRGAGTADLVRILTRVFQVLPDTAAETVFANAVVVRWQTPDVALQMLTRARNAGQLERALVWAEALVRSNPEGLPATVMETIAPVAQANGRLQLVDDWIAKAQRENPLAALKHEIGQAFERRDFSRARDLLSRVVKESPSDIDARIRLVRALFQSGHLAEAEKAAENARRQVPDAPDIGRMKFELALLRGDTDQAIAMAAQFGPLSTARFASESDLLTLAIGEMLRRGDLAAASGMVATLASATERLILLPRRQPIVFEYLRMIGRLGSTADMEALARRAIGEGYNQARILDALAEHLQSSGDLKSALAATAEGLEHGADAFERRRRYAQLLVRFSRWDEALDLTHQLLLERPNVVALMQLRSQVLAGVDRVDEAEALLRLAVFQSRGRIDILHELAAFLRGRRRLETEISSLRTHVQRFPNDLSAKLQLAICQYHNGELAEADRTLAAMMSGSRYDITVLEFHVTVRYLRMDYGGALDLVAVLDAPRVSVPATTRRISALYRQIFDYSGSARPLRRAFHAGVTDVSVLVGLLEYATEWEDPAEALASSMRVIDHHPLEPRGYFYRGLVLHQAGEIEAARVALKSALFVRHSDPTALMQLGHIEEELGNFEGALAWYDRSVKASTDAGRSPSARTLWHRFLVLMIMGRPAEAAGAHRLQCELYEDVFPRHLKVWQGEALGGKSLAIAVRGGPGDELRLAAMCLQRLQDEGIRDCTFACDPRLYTLLRRSYPEIDFVPTFSGHRQLRRDDGGKSPTLDRVWPGVAPRVVEMAMPFERMAGQDFVCHSDRLFHETYVEAVLRQGEPLRHRFAVPDPARVQEMRAHLAKLGPKPKVGLCWRGSFINRYRKRGYFSIDEIASILAVKDVTFVDLQVNQSVEEAAALQAAGVHAIPGLNLYDDFEGVAALVSELDLVLTPGVTIRDIAAAVNVPVWSFTVIPGASDVWRKGAQRRDSWFPSIVHYDLLSLGTRENVIACVAADLRGLAGKGASAGSAPQAAE